MGARLKSAKTAAPGAAARGFTLLELVVVMAVIALVAAVVTPRFVLPARAPRPEIVSFLEKQRAQSIEKGEMVRVYDQAGALVAEPAGGHYDLAKGAKLDIRWPVRSVYQERQLIAIFYPDGTSIASDFDVVAAGAPGFPDQRVRVRISPMQGDIAYGS